MPSWDVSPCQNFFPYREHVTVHLPGRLQTSTSETFPSAKDVKSGANDVAYCPGTRITKSQSHSPQTTANAGTTLGLSSFYFQIKQSWWVFFGRSGHCLSILCLLRFSFNMRHLQFRLFEITNGFLCFFNVHLLSLILGFRDWNLLHLVRLLHLFSLYILSFCHCRLCAINCRFFGFGCCIHSWNRLRRLRCFGTWATHGASVQRCRWSWNRNFSDPLWALMQNTTLDLMEEESMNPWHPKNTHAGIHVHPGEHPQPVVGFPCCQHWKSWPESCWVSKNSPRWKGCCHVLGRPKFQFQIYDSTNLLSSSWKPLINLSMWCTVKRSIEASHLWRWHCYRDIDLRSPNSKIPSPKQNKHEVTFEKFPPIFLNERTTNCWTREKYWKATNGTSSGPVWNFHHPSKCPERWWNYWSWRFFPGQPAKGRSTQRGAGTAVAALFLLEVDQKKPRMRHIKS